MWMTENTQGVIGNEEDEQGGENKEPGKEK